MCEGPLGGGAGAERGVELVEVTAHQRATSVALSIDGSTRLGLASALGALFVGVSIAAGFGISAVCGVPTNPASLQVLPFLLVAVGVNDMFVMSHAAIQCQPSSNKRNWMEHTVVEAGPSITLTTSTLFVIFILLIIVIFVTFVVFIFLFLFDGDER